MKDSLRKIRQYEKLLASKRYLTETPVHDIMMANADYKTSNTPPDDSIFHKMEPEESWGTGSDTHAWFKFTLKNVAKDSFLKIKTDKTSTLNPQLLVYCDGKIRQGVDKNHFEVRIDECASTEIWIYAYTGMNIPSAKLYVTLCVLNNAINDLYYDILYPLQMLDYLNPESGEFAEIENYLYRAVSMLNFIDRDGLTDSAQAAHDYLLKEFYQGYCGKQHATVVCLGHTHIDCAWLWTLRQTKEKVQRSFGTALELMKRYPDYKFMSSTPLLYRDLKEEAPYLYDEVKQRIKEGRWEPEGAMWVEADCNLPSGESFVRQILFGKGFFKKEFGVDSRILWLPDVFGYSAALPQILKKSGVDWFVTNKIGWNDTNQTPYDTFRWKGIDGTSVYSYFMTAQDDNGSKTEQGTTYIGLTNAQMVSGTYKRFRQKNLHNEAILCYGFGDGGGGPTAEHLELLNRSKYGVPGSPITVTDFAGNFLSRLEKKIENNPDLPTWQGEIYLEYHRGTYTTQAKNKKFNRRGEFLYQNAELYSVIDKFENGTAYPKPSLDKGWEILLTNQFHDIIPGSSIREVYEQSDKDYAGAFKIGGDVLSGAFARIAEKAGKDDGYVVFNPSGFDNSFPLTVEGKTVIPAAPVAASGYSVVRDFKTTNSVKIENYTVNTNRYTVKFDSHWQIVSLFDKLACREVITDGKAANELRIYADRPDNYDAWEWQSYNRPDFRPITDFTSCEVVEDGVRKGLKIERKFQSSTVFQTIWFYDDLEKIDFDTKVDWHETHLMLKCAFPVDVKGEFATYDIQFGNVKRPTHANTGWDKAKFEVCAHKFADLSDGGYGVSLQNDCKYGYDIHDGLMQLSLLRSPTYPDSKADQGESSFVYSLVTHDGIFGARTVQLAYDLNRPMQAVKASGSRSGALASFSIVKADKDNLLCDTVKQSEEGNGTVLRFYEFLNSCQNVKFTLGINAKKVYLCDLMENPIEEIPVKDGVFNYRIKGFEIATFKVV